MTRYSYLYKFLFFIGFFVLLSNNVPAQSISITSLNCEYQINPLGIDDRNPRFSWTLFSDERGQRQTAYELIVSAAIREVRKGKGSMWSEGKVETDQSIHVEYQGEPLKSFTRYYWRVRVYDKKGVASRWSEINWFETAALSNSDWQGDWIGDGSVPFAQDADFYQDDRNPLFRKSFDAKKRIASARMYISGLGYYEAYLNGEKIGDRVLDPGWTTYDKQVLYSVYDITNQLQSGENKVGVMLGNGWYDPLPLRFWGALNWRDALATGRPKVKAMIRIQYMDGTAEVIGTDNTWQTAPGPIVRNSIYLGEHHDARLEDPNWCTIKGAQDGWTAATIVNGPTGTLSVQQQPPIRVTKVLKPIGIQETSPGVFVADMGQNFAGVARIRVSGPAGTKISLRYGEDVYPDGNVNVMTTVAGQIKVGNGGLGAPPVAWQEDTYILNGKGTEIWSPRFTFHGFRYVEIKGWPGTPTIEDIEGLRLNTDLKETGSFTSSNPMLNKLQDNIKWTFLSNAFSVISDCPGREKLAYGGDIFCTTETFMFNYGMPNFYAKIIQDHLNEQRPLGGITETAPFVGIADAGPGDKSGPLGFQLGFAHMIKKMYDFYGDKRIVEAHYEAVRKQVAFLRSKAKNHLFDTDLGDHESLDQKSIPLTASVFYLQHVRLLADMANILGKESDVFRYSAWGDEIQEAIIQTFGEGNGKFANGTQSDQLFALWSGVADAVDHDAAWHVLMNAFEQKNWHLSTGIFGTKMLFDVLREHDRNDVAYRIANQRDFPGWGHMIENGATTLWETWKYSDNTYSHNHPMFGSVGEWFYRSLVGINDGAPGFKRIIIKPQPAGDLTYARGEFQSVYGTIGSSWRIADQGFELAVEIPVNTQAEIWIPRAYGKLITENGKTLDQAEGIIHVRDEIDHTVVQAGSGHYQFNAAQ